MSFAGTLIRQENFLLPFQQAKKLWRTTKWTYPGLMKALPMYTKQNPVTSMVTDLGCPILKQSPLISVKF